MAHYTPLPRGAHLAAQPLAVEREAPHRETVLFARRGGGARVEDEGGAVLQQEVGIGGGAEGGEEGGGEGGGDEAVEGGGGADGEEAELLRGRRVGHGFCVGVGKEGDGEGWREGGGGGRWVESVPSLFIIC